MSEPKTEHAERPWAKTWPYAYPEAVASAGSVAAPLLAGFTITLIGLVIGTGSAIRWPGLALIVLSLAAVTLLLAVQAAFVARGWYVTPSDILAWWPDPAVHPGMDALTDTQAEHKAKHDLWAAVFRRSYNLGLVLLLLGVALCLAPPATYQGPSRWIAFGIFVAAAVAEAAWTVCGWASNLRTPTSARAMTASGLTETDQPS